MIELDGLRFGYRRGETIIDGLSWTFPRGATTALTGASGRGKSTLLYLLGLLLTPTGGTLWWDGLATAGLGDARRSALRGRDIGFVFQDAALDAARTVLDNVCEPALYRDAVDPRLRARALAMLDRFGVELRASHRPGQISGGQAQRVALCRALLHEPAVVLADEPTGNLDAAAAAVVLDAFDEAAHGGACVVVATHDPAVVARCDLVLAL